MVASCATVHKSHIAASMRSMQALNKLLHRVQISDSCLLRVLEALPSHSGLICTSQTS